MTEAWQDIYASRQSNKILTGTLSAIESQEDKNFAVIFYDGVKVIIPFEEMGIENINKTIVRSMIGAEVDFIVRGIDTEKEIAIASRKFAMNLRKKYELPKHEEGDVILARIVAIGKNHAVAEVYGIETKVPKEEIGYGYIDRINDLLQVGDRVPAKITKLDIENSVVEISIKQTKPNPFEQIDSKYKRGGEYLGTITGSQPYGYFVNLEPGIDVLCPNPYWKTKIEKGDKVTVRITRIDHKKQRITGVLKRLVRKAQ
jgi:small subunit ribosomal protein S1